MTLTQCHLWEQAPIIGTVDPVSLTTAATTAASDATDMSLIDKAVFTLLSGAIAGSGNVKMELQVSDTTVGSDFTTTGVTAHAVTTSTADNAQWQIELRSPDVPSGKRYSRALVTVAGLSGTETAVVAVIVQPQGNRYKTAELSSVVTHVAP